MTVIPVEPAGCIFCTSAPAEVVASGRDYEYASTPDLFEFVRCAGCGLVFIRPRPADAAMSVIYPSNYYAYNEEEGEVGFIKALRDRVEGIKIRRYAEHVTRSDAEVVDIGCGDGRLLDVIERRGPAGWRLAGIELGEGAAARASARGFDVVAGDFEALPLLDWKQRFDLGLMHHVIEHTRDPRGAVRKAAGLLRPGALFSVETPDLRGWDFALFQRRYWGGWHIPRHFYLFDHQTLPRLLEEEGFEIVSVRSILSPAFWIFSWHNWFVDRSWGRRLAGWCHPQNFLAVGAATALEIAQALLRRPSSNLQVLARKRSIG